MTTASPVMAATTPMSSPPDYRADGSSSYFPNYETAQSPASGTPSIRLKSPTPVPTQPVVETSTPQEVSPVYVFPPQSQHQKHPSITFRRKSRLLRSFLRATSTSSSPHSFNGSPVAPAANTRATTTVNTAHGSSSFASIASPFCNLIPSHFTNKDKGTTSVSAPPSTFASSPSPSQSSSNNSSSAVSSSSLGLSKGGIDGQSPASSPLQQVTDNLATTENAEVQLEDAGNESTQFADIEYEYDDYEDDTLDRDLECIDPSFDVSKGSAAVIAGSSASVQSMVNNSDSGVNGNGNGNANPATTTNGVSGNVSNGTGNLTHMSSVYSSGVEENFGDDERSAIDLNIVGVNGNGRQRKKNTLVHRR
ncbi:unnamed protein product [Ambrosiozyma monospora]|uniref:Unnamed protein product n=1 Tax=Ambrosiozyma monospora TaxID=43982 RepID=A0ACB5TVL8_AMBMO|nr:unnamed protein product [Ambrosiozyma monospora]